MGEPCTSIYECRSPYACGRDGVCARSCADDADCADNGAATACVDFVCVLPETPGASG